MIEFKLLWYYQSKELGLLGEVIGFRSRSRKNTDETGMYLVMPEK